MVALIPAQGSTTQGASYEFIDNEVKNRKTYYYKLEDYRLERHINHAWASECNCHDLWGGEIDAVVAIAKGW